MGSGYSGSGRRLSCRPPPPSLPRPAGDRPPAARRDGPGPPAHPALCSSPHARCGAAPDQHPTMPAECGFRVSGGLLIASAPFTSAEGNRDSLSRKTLKNPSGAARWGERGKKLCCSSFPHGGSEAEKTDGGRGPERGLSSGCLPCYSSPLRNIPCCSISS
ncbi:EP300-interacting inhibitor of differentiation 2 isoform X2 [Falco peregrinus]|uniref:EP300-interacting inhibitor of differentiation 2 isoform X2 n=1 Tax=Falco peregrinus TaxID=8954 RepID=UPI00247A8A31|nr:EP300-interacting inhibitor of differentiation 2 isoform X2 [Falco peregrinus]